MNNNEINLNDLSLDPTLLESFTSQKLKINGFIKYLCTHGFTIINKGFKPSVINPECIAYTPNHYVNNDEINWKHCIKTKERCRFESILKKTKVNPLYFVNGELSSSSDTPRFLEYKTLFYNFSVRNHRTVMMKYIWQYSKQFYINKGYNGFLVQTKNINHTKNHIPLLSLHKFLCKNSWLKQYSLFYDIKLSKTNCPVIVISKSHHIDPFSKIFEITDVDEFKKALRFLLPFKKQLLYAKLFKKLFGVYNQKFDNNNSLYFYTFLYFIVNRVKILTKAKL